MCVIIIKQHDKQINEGTLELSSELNPHGLGIVWLDTYEITFHESEEWRLLKTDRPFIAHFRLATMGAINKANRHPFKVDKNEWVMQNGTIYGMGNDKICDTKELAQKLSTIERFTWTSELGKYNCRFVTINTKNKSFQIYNKRDWIKHDGCWYSKGNVLRNNLVAVYGTLKMGHSNYSHFLGDADYVDMGETMDKYPLQVNGLPYMYDKKGKGHHVDVDVFNVTDSELRSLDSLEGHPNFYKRKEIEVNTLSNGVIKCWVYFYQGNLHQGRPMVNSYTRYSKLIK